jgi:hypothetical protein
MPLTSHRVQRPVISIAPRRARAGPTLDRPRAFEAVRETIVLEASREGAARMLALPALVGVRTARRLAFRTNASDPLRLAMLAIVVLLVAFGLAYFVRRLVRGGVAVQVDGVGIANDASLLHAGRVACTEIASAEIHAFAQLRTLHIWLRDPRASSGGSHSARARCCGRRWRSAAHRSRCRRRCSPFG